MNGILLGFIYRDIYLKANNNKKRGGVDDDDDDENECAVAVAVAVPVGVGIGPPGGAA